MSIKSLSAARRVLCVGSAVMDTFIRSDNFQVSEAGQKAMLCQTFGDKIEIDALQLRSGGGATNTATAFQRLGFAASVVAELGTDNLAQLLMQDLKAEQLDVQYLIQERKEETGGSVILLGPDGQRIIMVHRGAASMLDDHDIPWDELAQFEWLHLSSLGSQSGLIVKLARFCSEQKIGWSWNPGSSELKALQRGDIALGTDVPEVLMMNDQEWASIEANHEVLRATVPIIVITRGKAGGFVYEHDMPVQAFTAAPVESVDDTGAGDAFAAGFVAARLRGEKVMTAARWGVLNAAAVVQQVGAKPGLLTYEQLIRHQQWYDEGIT